jgi:hypothetical protein
MIDNTPLRWVLCGVFAVATVYYLVRVVAARPVAERVSNGWHAVTSVSMVAMLWPWGMSIPPTLAVLVFGGAALWFVCLAVSSGRGWYHVVMMASMIWMWASMSHWMSHGPVHTAAAMGPPRWIAYVALGSGMFFLVAAVWFAVVVSRVLARQSAHNQGRADVNGCRANALMAGGMAAFLLAAA